MDFIAYAKAAGTKKLNHKCCKKYGCNEKMGLGKIG